MNRIQPAHLPGLFTTGTRPRREQAAEAVAAFLRELRAAHRWAKANQAAITGDLWLGLADAIEESARTLRLRLADLLNLRPDRVDVRTSYGFLPCSRKADKTGFTIALHRDWKRDGRFDDRFTLTV